MIQLPERIDTPTRTTAAIPIVVARARIAEVMGPAFHELFAVVASQGRTPTGPAFALHHRMSVDTFEFELGVPVDAPVTPEGRVVASSLPALRAVRTTMTGPYAGLSAAWAEFDAWIVAQGLTPAWPIWESYTLGPEREDDPERWQTELVHAIA